MNYVCLISIFSIVKNIAAKIGNNLPRKDIPHHLKSIVTNIYLHNFNLQLSIPISQQQQLGLTDITVTGVIENLKPNSSASSTYQTDAILP